MAYVPEPRLIAAAARLGEFTSEELRSKSGMGRQLARDFCARLCKVIRMERRRAGSAPVQVFAMRDTSEDGNG